MSLREMTHRFNDRVMKVHLEPGEYAAIVLVDISYRARERWRFTFIALLASICAFGFGTVRFVLIPRQFPNFGAEPHPNIGDLLVVLMFLTGAAAALGTWIAINTFRPVRIIRDFANERIEIRRPLRKNVRLTSNGAHLARQSRRHGDCWVTTVEFIVMEQARRVILARLALWKQQDLDATDLACTVLAEAVGVEFQRMQR